jgi:hypothetical protein
MRMSTQISLTIRKRTRIQKTRSLNDHWLHSIRVAKRANPELSDYMLWFLLRLGKYASELLRSL